MPELPDIGVYVAALADRVVDQPLLELRVLSPFVLRTVAPAPSQLAGLLVRHLAKQIVLSFAGDRYCVIHLMIASRLRWETVDKDPPRRSVLALWKFANGALWLTEAGKNGLPCRICQAPVQRIQYASNEANYCARCQTNGRLLSDRVLARLLKSSWPRTIDELE